MSSPAISSSIAGSGRGGGPAMLRPVARSKYALVAGAVEDALVERRDRRRTTGACTSGCTRASLPSRVPDQQAGIVLGRIVEHRRGCRAGASPSDRDLQARRRRRGAAHQALAPRSRPGRRRTRRSSAPGTSRSRAARRSCPPASRSGSRWRHRGWRRSAAIGRATRPGRASARSVLRAVPSALRAARPARIDAGSSRSAIVGHRQTSTSANGSAASVDHRQAQPRDARGLLVHRGRDVDSAAARVGLAAPSC